MIKPRDEQVSLGDAPFYHCYVRCVRRAYLYGIDSTTGHDYAHRKQWLVFRFRFLSYIYSTTSKSKALLDEATLLSCMTCVDLNPVRACMEKDLIDSDFTSIQRRLCDSVTDKHIGNNKTKSKDEARVVKNVVAQGEIKKVLELDAQPEGALMAFDGSTQSSTHRALSFTLEAYLALIDETCLCVCDDKRGRISPKSMTLVAQFHIDPDKWIEHILDFGRRYGHCAGSAHQLKRYAERSNQRWRKRAT